MSGWPDGAALWIDQTRRTSWWDAFYFGLMCAFRKSRFSDNCAHCGGRVAARRHDRWERYAMTRGWTAESFRNLEAKP